MRSDLRKPRLRQPELIENHRRFLSETVNHNQINEPSCLWVWTLIRQTILERLILPRLKFCCWIFRWRQGHQNNHRNWSHGDRLRMRVIGEPMWRIEGTRAGRYGRFAALRESWF
jgi:hypothetical protein